MRIGNGIIYIRIQLLNCRRNKVCAYGYLRIEVSKRIELT